MAVKQRQAEAPPERIDHPAHYQCGSSGVYETIRVIEAWELNFNLGNVVKYISRCDKKFENEALTDLKKAAWYLNREIENREASK